MKKLVLAVLLCVASPFSVAAGLINQMQSCQGLIDFLDAKLESAPAKYALSDVAKVRKGLAGYNQYIQNEIVTPGLLQFNGGDQTKANVMQQQVDAYKQTLVKQLQARYPQNRLFTDHAVAVNDCAKKAVPQGAALDDLRDALNIMVTLAKMN